MEPFVKYFMAIHYAMSTIGVCLNIFLIFLITRHTPQNIRTYSMLILNFACTDFSVCLADMFTQQSYSVMLHLYAHSLYSLLLTFFYRYYILKVKQPTTKTIIIWILATYSPSLFQLITFNMSSATAEQVDIILATCNSTSGGQTTSGNWNVLEWKTAFTMFHMTLPVTPVYAAILILRKKTIRILAEHGGMSPDTKTMHSLLLQALTYQACLPCLYWIGVISYGLGQTGLVHHPALEYLTFMSFVFIPVISPLLSMYFVKPYRNWIGGHAPVQRRRNTVTADVVYISTFDS